MGETAEERARRLRQIEEGKAFWRITQDDTYFNLGTDYEQMLDDICREMIDEVCDEPKVSLVKEYSKGSFKFV
jgi:hypothetical protein